jgi:hypothetical protein
MFDRGRRVAGPSRQFGQPPPQPEDADVDRAGAYVVDPGGPYQAGQPVGGQRGTFSRQQHTEQAPHHGGPGQRYRLPPVLDGQRSQDAEPDGWIPHRRPSPRTGRPAQPDR